MTHRWKQTITINSDTACKLIEGQHHFDVSTISLLDEGWDNVVYLVNENLIFRFPRREISVIYMENEITLLPFIATHLSFPLSSPQWVGQPSDAYPYPFSGYKIIPGKPLCDATQTLIQDKDVASMLAGWLKELHSIKVTDDYAALIKGDQTWRLDVVNRISRCKEFITRYEEYFVQAGFQKSLLLTVLDLFNHLNFTTARKSYLHGDLYSRHVIVHPETLSLSGLIDWGDVHLGHPGIDLAIGMIFTEETFKVFLDAYDDIDEETIHILLFHSFCHSISFLPYAYEQDKESLKLWGSLALVRAISEIKKLVKM